MEGSKKKLIRITTKPGSMTCLLEGQLNFMRNSFTVLAISSGGPKFKKMLYEQKVNGFCVEMTRRITPIKDLIALIKLTIIFFKVKPYIVHTHTPKAGTLGMIAAWIARVPHRVHTVAGLPLLVAKGPKRSLLNFVERVTYRCATKVLPNSFVLKDIIIQNKLGSTKKIEVVGNGSSNGIDTSFFSTGAVVKTKEELRKEFNIPQFSFVYIFVGRIVGDKGINELVEAFDLLYKKKHKIRLLLVGPYEKALDPLLSKTMNLIENHPGILSVGYQQDVRPFFKMADILVFPSYREGFPNVVMQAGAMGLPSIVSNINGCNEIIIPDMNGIIIEPKNTGELYLAMLQSYEDSQKISFLSTNARKLVKTRYERKYLWMELLKMYKSL